MHHELGWDGMLAETQQKDKGGKGDKGTGARLVRAGDQGSRKTVDCKISVVQDL